MPNSSKSTAIVIYEDRPSYETGIKLLILSLEANCPEASIHVFAPNATENFKSWINHHSATLHLKSPSNAKGWNAKPEVILWALDQGYSQAIWLDSDIIISRPLPKVLLEQPHDVLVASELPGLGKKNIHERTKWWGFQTGRSFALPISSCCSRFTKAHQPFLLHWNQMLQNPEYLRWQERPSQERPIEAYGDDSLFMALLGAKNYENLSVSLLKCGEDIAQCITPNSYKPKQRLKSLISGVPPIIHAMGPKPWLVPISERIYHSVSPYACVARKYQNKFARQEQDWLKLPKNWVNFWHNIVLGHPAISSLPLIYVSKISNKLSRLEPSKSNKPIADNVKTPVMASKSGK